jgi:hydroxymethylglutaryl-CoA lyase
LLAIVANTRGAAEAAAFEEIGYLGFPLSVSEQFQQRNTNKSIADALTTVAEIQEICLQKNKKQVVYLSMAFGNPYGEHFEEAMVVQMAEQLQRLGVEVVALSDTIGSSTPTLIKSMYRSVKSAFPSLELGLHLHSTPEKSEEKIEAALEVACERIDGALKGFGGCPMAKEELTGNIATEKIVDFINEKQTSSALRSDKLAEALLFAQQIFH